MAVKRCKCKKCKLCKQICHAANKWVTCKEYGEIVAPIYCDKFITSKDYKKQQKFTQNLILTEVLTYISQKEDE